MSTLSHDWKGFNISQRVSDGYVNLTEMAKACDKAVADYFRLATTKKYIRSLSSDMGIPISLMVTSVKGGDLTEIKQGTWAHPLIAMDFAQWVSIPFRIWANKTLKLVIESHPEIKVETVVKPGNVENLNKTGLNIAWIEESLNQSVKYLHANLSDPVAVNAYTKSIYNLQKLLERSKSAKETQHVYVETEEVEQNMDEFFNCEPVQTMNSLDLPEPKLIPPATEEEKESLVIPIAHSNTTFRQYVIGILKGMEEVCLQQLVVLVAKKFPGFVQRSYETRIINILRLQGFKRDPDREQILNLKTKDMKGRPHRMTLSTYVKVK